MEPKDGTGATPAGQGATPDHAEFDSWLSEQDQEVKDLVQARFKALEGALNSERDAREKMAKQVKDLAKAATEGSEAKKQLEAISADLAAATRRSSFYEGASGQGVSDLKLAYLAAEAGNHFTADGGVDYEALRKEHPTLFTTTKTPPPPGAAGNGTQDPPKAAHTMNDIIRGAAGR